MRNIQNFLFCVYKSLLTELIGRNMKIRVLMPAVGRAADTAVSSPKHSMFSEK